jgi:predicted DNA-binding transcriptional regulator AlpA
MSESKIACERKHFQGIGKKEANKRGMVQLLRAKQVAGRLSVSLSTLYRILGDPDTGFPMARRIGPNTVAWKEDELDKWINEREPVSGDEQEGVKTET